MRYHHVEPKYYCSIYGKKYMCNHPLYNYCTLYLIHDKGLAVIQQRFNAEDKTSWWGEIDEWLTDELYLHPGFKNFFDDRAAVESKGLFPTVTIRQIMWALKIKPVPRERWETYFDRKEI